jgi:biotin synthase
VIPRAEILRWLRDADDAGCVPLWREAEAARREWVGDAVHLRGLLEISNHCRRHCAYCGLRAGRTDLLRYRMTREEILEGARAAVAFGFGTVVLQAGEDPGLTSPWVAEVVRAIKSETPLAVTLSLGERSEEELSLWREAGADRYLLRFETSNPRLFAMIHPPLPGGGPDRLELLRTLRRLGYEVGSGVMIGIPGQVWDDLADDLLLFRSLELDMIGVGPYLPHPETPLGRAALGAADGRIGRTALEGSAAPDQVPADELTTLKMIALARLLCPWANIPSTTALATLDQAQGRELGLARGANVVMPNLTPLGFRQAYEIYPGKACLHETAEVCQACLRGRIASIGRTVGTGRGDARRPKDRQGVAR